MFVNDCCINSSFRLPIVLFSIASAILANCPNLKINHARDSCIDFPRGLTSNGSYVFDTAAVIDISQSGPCELHQQAMIATLHKVDTEMRQIFYCVYDNTIDDNRTLCRDSGRVKVKYNVERPGDLDAFNFGLELVNVQPSDSGVYQYDAIFFILGDTVERVLTKRFQVVGGEYNVNLYCIFLKVMIRGRKNILTLQQ